MLKFKEFLSKLDLFFFFFLNRVRELEKRKSSFDASTQTVETKEADAKEELGKEVKVVTRN